VSDGAGGPTSPPRGGERPPESASFETSRVGGSRRTRPPVLAAAFVLVLIAVVGVGLSGRLGAGSFPKDVAIGRTSPPTPEASALDGAAVPASSVLGIPAFPADTGPIYTSAPGPMHIEAKRHPQTIFVHGDVDADRITWVFVSVQDEVGRVAGWTSVSVPGAAGRNKSGGPALRFDTELAIPDDFEGPLFVRAQAYDLAGKVVASTTVEIPAATA
jgi:hypothetical protein